MAPRRQKDSTPRTTRNVAVAGDEHPVISALGGGGRKTRSSRSLIQAHNEVRPTCL